MTVFLERLRTMTSRMNIPGITSRRLATLALAGLVASLAGCAQIQTLGHKLGKTFGAKPQETTVQKAPAPRQSTPAPVVDTTPVVPLKTIVAEQLQHGHYAEGKRELKHYLQAHPDDAAARDLWHQLTVDPVRQLGSRHRIHVVQAGDSYSSLAARYLGDASRFLVLARYNHAHDPSLLQVGQRLRVPVSSKAVASPAPAPSAVDDGPDAGQAPAAEAAPTADAHPADSAEALQQQSVTLQQQGHHAQAMARLGQALQMDPKLKSSGPQADALRKQLLASYHQQAIVLYRDQKLQQAISLWDRILAIDPDYEPAIIYRTRARELQSRLKQL